MTIITSITPPEIMQWFDKNLLSTPCKLNEDEETIKEILANIRKKYDRKIRKTPGKINEYIFLIAHIETLYERIKEKKAQLKPEDKNRAQEPMYYLKGTSYKRAELFRRFKYAKTRNTKRWQNDGF